MRKPRLSRRLQDMEIALHAKGDWNPFDDNKKGSYYGKDRKARDAHEKAIADQQAAVLREQIKSNERIAADTNRAMERATRDGGIATIVGAALGANTTNETIKQLLPHERGAATMMSWELAQKWNTTREMKESGYSGVAIEYALQNKSYKALYADPEYATMMMKTQQRKDMITNLQTFGVRGAGNPHGVDMTADQFLEMHALKDPESMLHVDPQIARQRQAEFDKWERDMRAQGKGILVDIYKNPQLAGHGVQAMKGKEAPIPKEMMPLIQSIAGDGGGQGGTNWGEVIKQMGRGETTPHTKEIEWAQQNGIIDKYGHVATDALMSHIPPHLMDAPKFDPVRKLTDEEKAKLLDDYNRFTNIKVDPKLVQEKQVGMGLTEKVKLNPDGTVAGRVMEGYMTSPTGEQIFMSLPNGSLRDWKAKESQMLSGLGPNFPGQLALSSQAELNGDMSHTRQNQLATPNTTGLKGPQMTSAANPYGTKPTQGAAPSPAPAPINTGASGSVIKQGSNPAASAGGAPLAAGED